MNLVERIDYNRRILLFDNLEDNNYRQKIYIEKSFCKDNKKDQFFIKIYRDNNGNLECQGYIYFYLDLINRTSTYIGTYVKPEFRNHGIASLLTSCWIMLCLNNGIYDLTTNKRQRKPFLLYLLKTFYFELNDASKYVSSRYNIHICQKGNDPTKYLLFDNLIQQETFLHSNVYSGDNYKIITEPDDDTTILDTVLLSNVYNGQDNEEAYKRSLKVIDKHKSI